MERSSTLNKKTAGKRGRRSDSHPCHPGAIVAPRTHATTPRRVETRVYDTVPPRLSCHEACRWGLQFGQQAPSEPLAIVYGDVEGLSEVAVRVHDACFTSEVLGSMKCDCAEQLNYALNYIKENSPGIVIYLQQVNAPNQGLLGRFFVVPVGAWPVPGFGWVYGPV
jgi:hypothetical protein